MKKGTYLDLCGQKYSKLTVISLNRLTSQGAFFNCICDCGNECIVRGHNMRRRHTTSCGCVGLQRLGLRRTTHGLSKTYEYKLWTQAKSRARKFNRPFNIEVSDIIIPDICPLLGVPIFRNVDKVGSNSPSVDCIIPELGYTKGNVWVVSYKANTVKGKLSLIQLQTFVQVLEEKIRRMHE
jgi:hypothetical protein